MALGRQQQSVQHVDLCFQALGIILSFLQDLSCLVLQRSIAI